jgi:hypothetical protein
MKAARFFDSLSHEVNSVAQRRVGAQADHHAELSSGARTYIQNFAIVQWQAARHSEQAGVHPPSLLENHPVSSVGKRVALLDPPVHSASPVNLNNAVDFVVRRHHGSGLGSNPHVAED